MSTENKIAKFMRASVLPRFLLPLIIVCIIFGVILTVFNHDDYITTEGEVIETDGGTYDTATESWEYKITVKYTVEEVNHSSIITTGKNYQVGDKITISYNPASPEDIVTPTPTFLPYIFFAAAGVCLVIMIVSIVNFIKREQEMKQQDQAYEQAAKDEYSYNPSDYVAREKSDVEVEYYYRLVKFGSIKHDYVIEDKDRNPIFEAINHKAPLIGDRTFEFVNHITNTRTTHMVGHTVTSSFNDELLSANSRFTFDKQNIWDYLHKMGVRIDTDLTYVFPRSKYTIKYKGEVIATAESTSQYVHEEDAEMHKVNIPLGRMFYRVWTKEVDLEIIFLVLFAISETEQVVYE